MPKLSPKKQEALEQLIKRAKYLYQVEGYDLRSIGKELKMSHEWVRRKVYQIGKFGKKADVDN